MSDYTYPGSAADMGALITELETKFTTALDVDYSGGGLAYSNTTNGYTDIHDIEVDNIEADDLVEVDVALNVSSSDTGVGWVFRIKLGASTYSQEKTWLADTNVATGKKDIVHLHYTFKDLSAGTHTIVAQAKGASTPTGHVYCDSCDIEVRRTKQRA